MIIVEGPDGAGKTTLIKQLQREFGLEVAPRVVTKNAEAMVDLKTWVTQNLAEGFQYKIFDRHRLISEYIYGPLLRKKQEPGFTDLIWSYIQLNKLYNSVKPVIIYCLPPLEVVRANVLADHENSVVAPHVDAMYTAYVHRASLDWLRKDGRTIIYDYTTDGQEENPLAIFKNLINYAKERANQVTNEPGTQYNMKPQNDHMQDWLDSQSELQYKMPSAHPTELYLRSRGMPPVEGPDHWVPTDEDRMPAIDFIHWNVTALIDELHELLGEIGWKPWAKSRHINLDAARGEFIDAMHFMANLALVLGLNDAEEILRLYHKKHEKNAKRQEEGYDGVSTKCPGCHRALDDDAVLCTVTYWDGVGEEAQQTDAAHSVKAEYYCFTEGRTIA